MKTVYATNFYSNYLIRALCLYHSFVRNSSSAMFGFYCMDDEAYLTLRKFKLERAYIVPHDEFATSELKSFRATRSVAEYCWTSKPAILSHALQTNPTLDWAVYLDADTMVFSDPDESLHRHNNAHFLLTPHRFSKSFAHYATSVGFHNAGYAAFRNDSIGQEALDAWFLRCLKSCSSEVNENGYADQKYLDDLLAEFIGGESISQKGMNAAPWNIENYRVAITRGKIHLDEEKLILYHFQGLRIHSRNMYNMYTGDYALSADVIKYIYIPYLLGLREARKQIDSARPDIKFDLGISPFFSKPSVLYRQAKAFLLRKSNIAILH